MNLCYQCFYAPIDFSRCEQRLECLKCLTNNGYYWNGTQWAISRNDPPSCKDCAKFAPDDFWNSDCDKCIDNTIHGIVKHKFVSKPSGSPVDASEPKSDDISLPNTNSLSDRVRRHAEICAELTDLYERKNHDYGDSFHKTFTEEGYAMSRIRLSDKLERFKSLTKGDKAQVKDESVRDTLLDLANYAVMTVIEMERDGK